MKKLTVFSAAGMLAFAMGTAVFAPADLTQAQAHSRICRFVDRNHDGICDRCSNRCTHRTVSRSSCGSHYSGHHGSHH